MPDFDERDGEILAERRLRRDQFPGPRVGDFVWINGELRRFAHHWGDGIQPTSGPSTGPRDIGAGGSFHLCRNGDSEHSGGLDRAIPIELLRDTGETQDGWFWFFHHDHSGAHRDVSFKIPCRVFEVLSRCPQCSKPIGQLEVFPGGICVECHGKKFDADLRTARLLGREAEFWAAVKPDFGAAADEWARKQGEALQAQAGYRDHDRVGEKARELAREKLKEIVAELPGGATAAERELAARTDALLAKPDRERVWTPDEIRAVVEYNRTVDPRDPRRLLPGMHPIFRDHNCARCKDGERACVRGDPGRCDWPHARND